MNAISLWEPWATAMMVGAKKNETRHWPFPARYLGKPLLICAAKRCVKHEILDVLGEWTMELGESKMAHRSLGDLHFGKAVCFVTVVDCKPTEQLKDTISHEEYFMGNYESGRYGWITENLRPVVPFPVKGSQGFFDVPYMDATRAVVQEAQQRLDL